MEGVRLLVAQETSEGKQLDVEKIKRMTGNDAKIHACRKFHDQYDFNPVWKIWLATNSRPDAPASDEATWDRLKVIPFDVRFRGQSDEIQNLAEKLVAEEGSGILNWMLEGHACRRMKNLRNHQSEKVSIAVNDLARHYRLLCSVLGRQRSRWSLRGAKQPIQALRVVGRDEQGGKKHEHAQVQGGDEAAWFCPQGLVPRERQSHQCLGRHSAQRYGSRGNYARSRSFAGV
jgi:hypothetical protein